jgi:hypothetical protein
MVHEVMRDPSQKYCWSDAVLLSASVGASLFTISIFVMTGGPWLLDQFPDWINLPVVPVLLVPTCAFIFWRYRFRHILLDYFMLFLPVMVWVLATIVYKIIVWHFTGGIPFYLSYGADKGFGNLIVEPILVLLAQSFYYLRFLVTNRDELSFRFALPVLVMTVLVAILFPPLAE